jgi:hypothetical protein
MAFVTTSCAALQPSGVGEPKANEPTYPILMGQDPTRQEEALVAWQQFVKTAGPSPQPQVVLQPFTTTIKHFPQNSNVAIFLPKVGAGPKMTEEETREALRRFINEWQRLIGAEPSQLSLIDHTAQPDGTSVARYEQHPFRYPLKNGYGKLEILFNADERVIDVSSTCIPDADRLLPQFPTVGQRLRSAEALKRVSNSPITYTNANGQKQTYLLTVANSLEVLELVVYPVPTDGESGALELHLAWEIQVTNAPFTMIYLDAVQGEIIAVS